MQVNNETQSSIPHAHHVVPQPYGGWSVRESRIAKIFPTQREALEFAQEMSRQQGTELVIYGLKGEILYTQHPEADQARPEKGFGCAKGLILISPEFENPLEEFDEIF